VLGTVPVEADGSAFFEVPARTPVLFQASMPRVARCRRCAVSYIFSPASIGAVLDATNSERRPAQVATPAQALGARRRNQTRPDGSRPFSYPRLVQPVLDRTAFGAMMARSQDGPC